jgi:hypothetical protein
MIYEPKLCGTEVLIEKSQRMNKWPFTCKVSMNSTRISRHVVIRYPWPVGKPTDLWSCIDLLRSYLPGILHTVSMNRPAMDIFTCLHWSYRNSLHVQVWQTLFTLDSASCFNVGPQAHAKQCIWMPRLHSSLPVPCLSEHLAHETCAELAEVMQKHCVWLAKVV